MRCLEKEPEQALRLDEGPAQRAQARRQRGRLAHRHAREHAAARRLELAAVGRLARAGRVGSGAADHPAPVAASSSSRATQQPALRVALDQRDAELGRRTTRRRPSRRARQGAHVRVGRRRGRGRARGRPRRVLSPGRAPTIDGAAAPGARRPPTPRRPRRRRRDGHGGADRDGDGRPRRAEPVVRVVRVESEPSRRERHRGRHRALHGDPVRADVEGRRGERRAQAQDQQEGLQDLQGSRSAPATRR